MNNNNKYKSKQYNTKVTNSSSLPELFKELQDIRSGKVKSFEIPEIKKKIKV